MAIQRWRPWDAFREMERHMDEMTRYPSIFRHPLYWWPMPTAEQSAWIPALEVYEKEDKYTVRIEAPGIKEEDIDISVLGDTLTIKGERKAESEVKDEDYHRCEFCYGNFYRTITLPTAVKADKVEANYQDGILEVSLPKAAETKLKKITVKSKPAKAIETKSK